MCLGLVFVDSLCFGLFYLNGALDWPVPLGVASSIGSPLCLGIAISIGISIGNPLGEWRLGVGTSIGNPLGEWPWSGQLHLESTWGLGP